MIALDCESPGAALESICRIYDVTEAQVTTFIDGLDLEAHYQEHDPPQSGSEELARLFERDLGCTMRTLDRVYWFHLTRVPARATFSEGILPLSHALPGIWDTIEGALQGTGNEHSFKDFRTSGRGSYQYRLKQDRAVHAGPFAMLVRETAFRAPEIGNHDYLGLPEIVEDICDGYHEHSGNLIHETVRRILAPRIVKFWSDEQTGKDCVEAALYYLYGHRHGDSLSTEGNTCFNGKGIMIPPDRIVRVEAIGK